MDFLFGYGDITWCTDSVDCDSIECFRHTFNMRRRPKDTGVMIFSQASFKNTEVCPLYAKTKEGEE